MKNYNFIKLILNNFKRNKENLIFIAIVLILNLVIIIGLSYYLSIIRFWEDWTKKAYDFNMIIIPPISDSTKSELLNNKHVRDVFSYPEYQTYGIFTDFKTSTYNGEVQLIGTIPNTKKILYGSDLSLDNDNEMICPSNFFPDSSIYIGNYNAFKNIDLRPYLNKNINIDYVGLKDSKISLKLVGIFDGSYDYSYPNFCYTSHSTLKNLNSVYQPDLKGDDFGVFVLLDDISNAKEVLNEYNISSYTVVKRIKTEEGDKLIQIIAIISLVLLLIIFIICYLINSRRIVKNYRNIGLLKVCGYSKKDINKIFYFENIICLFISFVIGIIVSCIIMANFPDIFLVKEPFLSLMHTDVNIIVILLEIFIISLIVILSTKISLNKIEKIDVTEIIYE